MAPACVANCGVRFSSAFIVSSTTPAASSSSSRPAGVSAAIARRASRLLLTVDTMPSFSMGRSARVTLAGEPVGWIGELHPRWQQKYELPQAPVLFEVDVAPLLPVALPVATAVPKFPEVQRDVALWFDEAVPLQAIYDVVGELVQADARLRCLRQFRLFDLYRPSVRASSKVEEVGANALLNKEKSLAFRLVLQDTERTLAEAQAEAAVAAVVEGLSTRLNARLRR